MAHRPEAAIEVIGWSDRELEELYVDTVKSAYHELSARIDGMPQTIRIYFDDRMIHENFPADGTAYSRDIITLVINRKYRNRPDEISRQLRATVFHEGFHIRQGFTLADGKFSAIEAAIYEGCASAFEREHTRTLPLQANYHETSDEKLREWYKTIRGIAADEYFESSGETWRKWAFYDPETNERWRIYKVGTWIVDTVLASRGVDIIELRDANPGQIEKWFVEA